MGHVEQAGTWHESSYLLVETYDVTVPRGWSIPLEQQPYGEVFWIESGCLLVELGDESRVAEPGQLVTLLPGTNRLTEARAVDARFVGFGFRLQLFGAIEMSGLLGLPLVIEQPPESVLALIGSAVDHGGRPGAANALTARAHAELATAELVAGFGAARDVPRARLRPEIEAALALMEQDLSEGLDVAALARAANMSAKHFAACFRQLVGVPPMAYLQAMRLSRARAALAESTQTTTSIAAGHGFADAAHFSRAFKRQYGLSPTQFRQRLRSLSGEPIGVPSDNLAGFSDKRSA